MKRHPYLVVGLLAAAALGGCAKAGSGKGTRDTRPAVGQVGTIQDDGKKNQTPTNPADPQSKTTNHAPTLGAPVPLGVTLTGTGTQADPFAFTLALGQKDGSIKLLAGDTDQDKLTLTCASAPTYATVDNDGKQLTFYPDKDAYGSTTAVAFNCKVNDGKLDSNIQYFAVTVPPAAMSIDAKLTLAACFKLDAKEVADVVGWTDTATSQAAAVAFCDKLSQVKFDGKGPDPTLTAVDVK